MAMRMPIAGLLAAALGFTAVLSLAGAQPPKTPPAAEEEEAFETIDTLCPCFFEVLQRCWANLVRSRPAMTGAEPEGPTCPYLKQKALPNNQVHDGLADKPVSVLDNLGKLEKANNFYEQAEFYRRTGHPGSAVYYYQLVREQCPGSRYDQMAAQQINDLRAREASETTFIAPEEQEVPSDAPQLLEWIWEGIWLFDPPSHLTPERVHGGIQESRLQPELPPLDPALVTALERLLAEAGDPDLPKLIFPTESSDAEEEQEPDPALGWVPGAAEEELPVLLVFPEDPNPPAESEEGDDEEEDEGIPEFVPDWNQVLREVLDAVSAGTCVEIDGSRLGHLRFLCQKQVGAVTVRVFSDGDGVWRCIVASLDLEATGDLRATQRAFNDRIGQWIEALGACTGEEPLDDEDDWLADDLEPDDEDISPNF